jgi:hypothetical protein
MNHVLLLISFQTGTTYDAKEDFFAKNGAKKGFVINNSERRVLRRDKGGVAFCVLNKDDLT